MCTMKISFQVRNPSLLISKINIESFYTLLYIISLLSPAFSLLSLNRIKPKKARNSLPIQRKAVLLQADYYHKMIRD